MGNEKPLVCLAVLFLHAVLAFSAAEGEGGVRRLQQRRTEEVEITADNIGRLPRLVRNAERDTVFVFTTDLQLPSMITVAQNRITFRGDADARPTLTCAEGESGFQIKSPLSEPLENFVIRDCGQTAVRIFDAEASDPSDPFNFEPVEARRLDTTITNVDFINNQGITQVSSAGGLSGGDRVRITVRSCTFEQNSGVSGGAISFIGSSLIVEECTFRDNVAVRSGGAIFLIREFFEQEGETEEKVFRVTDSTFRGNHVERGSEDTTGLTTTSLINLEANPYLDFPLPSPSGGAIYVSDFTEVRFETSTFRENHALAGGAIYLSDNLDMSMERCRFADNYVGPPSNAAVAEDLQVGGAVFAAFTETTSELQIFNSDFVNNTAVYGGALHYVGPIEATVQLRWCRFNDNVATLGGGAAVFRNILSPILANTRFENNSAFVGGAVFVTNGGGLRMREADSDDQASYFHDNVAFDGGAVFAIGGGEVMFNRVFFRRNKAERNGGAICFIDAKAGGALNIQDARMIDNAAGLGGAIFLENVARFFMTTGSADRGLALFNIEDIPRNDFINNTAVAGGALYYRASNLVDNGLTMDNANFVDNTAQSDLSLVHPEPLQYPQAARNRQGRGLLQLAEEIQQETSSLVDPASATPCHPGGGGAVCLVLSGISVRAPVSVEMIRCNFTRNTAVVAGAMLISTEPDVDWLASCPSSTDSTARLFSSDPCRNLNLRGLMFRRNTAEHAGGAIFASNLHHVHFSTETEENVDFNYQTLDRVATGPHFFKNQVAGKGYGHNVASMAVRLNVSSPVVDPETGLLVANQSSGQSNKLPLIQIQVLDGLNQTVSAGIVDSSLRISVDAENPEDSSSIATGQVVASADEGIATFESLSLSAPAGEYEVVFAVRGSDVEDDRGIVELRECLLGELYIESDSVCSTCAAETFTFFSNASLCSECPDDAACAGGASLVPFSGYWHSSPFSVLIHECFHSDACSYDDRRTELETRRNDHLEEFLRRFDQDDQPVFTNEEYPQCAVGYEGPLCGSCQDGYGHADGKSCAKCDSKSATASVIFLLAVWQLIFLSITIRSALVSIRDMNQMMAIAQQQATATTQPSRRTTAASGGGTRRASAFMVLHQDSNVTQAAVSRTGTATGGGLSRTITGPEAEAQIAATLGAPNAPTQPSITQPTPKQQLSADYIIAAQHVSETIKIFVNFFQVTSVAVNINLEWTASIKNMLAAMNSVAGFSNGATFTPMTCLLDSDSDLRSIHGVILRIAFPLCLMVLVMCVFGLQWFFMRRAPNITRTACQQFLRSRTIIVFLVVGFFSYQSISEDLMGTVSCIQLDEDDLSEARPYDDRARVSYSHFSIARDRYWTEDTNIECLSQNHAYLIGFLGIPGIVLFLCGVPLYLLIFLLYKRHQNQLMELNVLNTYGFIYQNYEDKFVYWEVCILVRKALIGAIVVFAYPLGANLQGIMALGVLILSLAIHLIATPFKYLPLNILEGASLVVSIFTFYAGVVFNDENTSDSATVLLSVLLVVINSLLVVVILFTVFVYGDKYVVAKLKFMDVTYIPGNPVSRALLLASVLGERVHKVVTRTVHRTLRGSAAQRARTGTTQMISLPAPVRTKPTSQPQATPHDAAVIDVTAAQNDQL